MNLASLATLATAASLLASWFVPLASAALAKGAVPNDVAGYLTPLLAVVNGLVTEWARSPEHFNWGAALLNAVASYLIAIAAHSKTWKDSGIEARLLSVGNKQAPAPAAPAAQ